MGIKELGDKLRRRRPTQPPVTTTARPERDFMALIKARRLGLPICDEAITQAAKSIPQSTKAVEGNNEGALHGAEDNAILT